MTKKIKTIFFLGVFLGISSILAFSLFFSFANKKSFSKQTSKQLNQLVSQSTPVKTDEKFKNLFVGNNFNYKNLASVNLQNGEEKTKKTEVKKLFVQDIVKTQYLAGTKDKIFDNQNILDKTDFAIIFKNEKLIDQSLSLSSIVASQNVNQFFEIKPLTAKAKKYNFELKIKDENTSFSAQNLQNFTLSWKVNVLDKTTSQILQTLEINDQVYSQKIKINQVFAPTEIFSNTKNGSFNQYYNPSIWSVGNNTYFARQMLIILTIMGLKLME